MPSDLVRSPAHDRSRSLGWLAVRWIEHFCIHGPGDIQGATMRAGEPGAIPLSDELVRLTVDSYALGTDGRRLYDSVFYSRPKGADKSGHAARLAQFEALGPCRFGGWAEGGEVYELHDFRHVYEPGEPMGRNVTYPFLRVLATEEGQTGNVYDAIYYSLREGPLRDMFPRMDDVGLTRAFLAGGGEIRPSTASSSAKDGGKESWANFDETHLYTMPELRRMYATVRRNMAKRREAEPWSFESSTMYEPGRDSVAEKTHELARSIRDGKNHHGRLLFDHRYASLETDVRDEASLRAGFAEAYGDAAAYMDFDRMVTEAFDPRNAPEDTRRFFLNQAIASSGRAFDIEQWKALAKPDYSIADGAFVTLGFDGSRVNDSTGIVATEITTGHQQVVGLWENNGTDNWSVDEAAVDATMDEAFRTWKVWRAYCDPFYWESYIAKWAGKHGDKVVVEWRTNRWRMTATALQSYRTAIAGSELSHDGNEAFSRHIANSCRQPLGFKDEDGKPMWVITKERPMSPLKIDLAIAGCLSWEARNDAIKSGALLPEPKLEVFFA